MKKTTKTRMIKPKIARKQALKGAVLDFTMKAARLKRTLNDCSHGNGTTREKRMAAQTLTQHSHNVRRDSSAFNFVELKCFYFKIIC